MKIRDFLEVSENVVIHKKPIFIQEAFVQGTNISFKLNNTKWKQCTKVCFYAWSKKKNLVWRQNELSGWKEGKITFDLSSFQDMAKLGPARWDAYLAVTDDKNQVWFLRMEHNKNRFRIRRRNPFVFFRKHHENFKKQQTERFCQPIPVEGTNVNGEKIVISPEFTIDYVFCVQPVRQERAYMRAFFEVLQDVSLTEDELRLTIDVKERGFQIKGLVAELRNHPEECYSIPMVQKKSMSWGTRYTFSIHPMDIPWRPILWNFSVIEEKDGVEYQVRPRNPRRRFAKRFYWIEKRDYLTTIDPDSGDKMVVQLIHMRSGNVLVRNREYSIYDEPKYRKQERTARRLYLLGKPVLDRLGIMLLFERFSTCAQDNAAALFEYYMKQGRKRVYYVIDTTSPDYDRVRQYGKQVIPFMSLRHMIYIQAAKVLVSTDTKRHGYQWNGPNSRIYNKLLKKPVVFLQHGVLAMKIVSNTYDRYSSNAMDVFITSSEIEKDIVNRYFRYERNRIAVTGLARWDLLQDKRSEMKKPEILFIPTWRVWMDNIFKDEFLESIYYKNYESLLRSEELVQLLEQEDATLTFCMHHKFRKYAGEFESISPRIQIFDFGDVPVNELIMRCSLMVTDYSSVAWDAYYLEKPMIFYQFDYEQYMELQGSYFDMEKELFGERVLDNEHLILAMRRYMENGYEELPEYKELRKSYLPYRDKTHCQRIDQVIQQNKFHGKTKIV